jgi:hypothetical protein
LQQPRADGHSREEVAACHREEALLPGPAKRDRDESRSFADRHVQQTSTPAEHQRRDDRRMKQAVHEKPLPRDPQLAQRRSKPERRQQRDRGVVIAISERGDQRASWEHGHEPAREEPGPSAGQRSRDPECAQREERAERG